MTVECTNLVDKISGNDVTVLNGTSARPQPHVVNKEDVVKVPEQVDIKET